MTMNSGNNGEITHVSLVELSKEALEATCNWYIMHIYGMKLRSSTYPDCKDPMRSKDWKPDWVRQGRQAKFWDKIPVLHAFSGEIPL